MRLYQAVTLGAKSFPADENGALIKGIARHPIVEDDVVIYSGATILGRITIGAGKRGPVTEALQAAFFGLFTGKTPDKWGWLEPCNVTGAAAVGA